MAIQSYVTGNVLNYVGVGVKERGCSIGNNTQIFGSETTSVRKVVNVLR